MGDEGNEIAPSDSRPPGVICSSWSSAPCKSADCQTPSVDFSLRGTTNRDRRRANEGRRQLTMALRDDVRRVLNAICEGKGVAEDPDGDFCVELGALPRWVRVMEKPDTICVFGFLAFEVPRSSALDEFLH